MLPASLQSRIIPCRRSNSLHNLQAKNLSDEPRSRPRPLSEADALVLTNGRVVTEVLHDDRMSTADRYKSRAPPLPPRSPPFSPKDDEGLSRTASGIHWRYARQGMLCVVFK
jgi:hypothetical protein